MSRKTILIGLAALVAIGGGVALVTGRLTDRATATPVANVEAPGPVGVGALGRIEPASRVRKLNQAGGMNVTRVSALFVNEGDAVTSGQVLAEFADIAQKNAAVAQAEAALHQSEASLQRIQAAGRAEEIDAQRAQVLALKAAESSAVRDAARTDVLGPAGAAAAATVEHNRFAAAKATAERAQAEALLQRLIVPRQEDIVVAEADVEAARAAVVKARADADLSRVIAPMDGTILKIYARPGDQVGADGLLDMADLRQLDVVADVYETDVGRLSPGAAAQVVVPGDTRRYGATLREIGWIVRRTTQAGSDPVAAVDARTVEVRLALDEAGRAALARRTNMQVQVSIQP